MSFDPCVDLSLCLGNVCSAVLVSYDDEDEADCAEDSRYETECDGHALTSSALENDSFLPVCSVEACSDDDTAEEDTDLKRYVLKTHYPAGRIVSFFGSDHNYGVGIESREGTESHSIEEERQG